MRAPASAAALALGLTVVVSARAQMIPLGPPVPSAAPSSPPAPAVAPTPPPAPAPAVPPAPPASASSETVAAPTDTAPGSTPPGFYVEPAPTATSGGPAPTSMTIYEPPPPPGAVVFEPPPPPVPHHVAPKNAFWAGARLGWFVPFGSAYALGLRDSEGYLYLDPVPWKDYVSSGPSIEVDVGARIARNYNVFGLWEHAELGSGGAESDLYGGQDGGQTDYFAAGIRATTDADRIGFLTELAIGYRQARAIWNDGSELRMTGGVLEGRIGLGADIRLNPTFSLSPMLAVGVGSFDRLRRVVDGGGSYDLIGPNDSPGSHGWLSISLGGHVDLFGGR